MLKGLLITSIFFSAWLQVRYCEEYHVTANGEDTSFCGSIWNKCRTLKHTIENRIESGDTITLVGAAVYYEDDPIIVTKNFTLQASKKIILKPVIHVSSKKKLSRLFIFPQSNRIAIIIERVIFWDLSLAEIPNHGSVTAKDCFFRDSQDSVFGGKMSGDVNIYVLRSEFSACQSVLKVGVFGNLRINLESCHLHGDFKKPSSNRGVLILSKNQGGDSLQFISNGTTFSWLTCALIVQLSVLQKNANMHVYNSHFLENSDDGSFSDIGSAVTVHGGLKSFHIENTIFEKNKGIKAGALYLKYIVAYLRNCTFLSNRVAMYGAGCLLEVSKVYIYDSKFVNNSATYQYLETHDNLITGQGGAIANRNESTLNIYQSNFTNNSAFLFGGSIYHVGKHLGIVDSVFDGPGTATEPSLHGSLFYSTQNTKVDNCSFKTRLSKSLRSVIFQSGSSYEQVIELKLPFEFSCQSGHKIMRAFNTAHKRTRFGLFMFFCEQCPSQSYSIETEYYRRTSTSEHTINNITCIKCPHGGVCEQGKIKSLPNFWGWRSGKTVEFIPCRSSSYCCSDKNVCQTYDSCDRDRTGIMCGQCRAGYTESIFSRICVSNKECSGIWLWIVFFLISLCYVFVLMYLKDIFSCLKRVVDLPVNIFKKIERKRLVVIDKNGNIEDVFDDEDYVIVHRDQDCCDQEPELTQSTESSIQHDFQSSYQRYALMNDDSADSVSLLTLENKLPNRVKRKWYSYVAGVVKILMFFYQMQFLSKVPSTLEDSYDLPGPRLLKEFVTGIFTLQAFSGRDSIFHTCLVKDLDPLGKQVLKIMFIIFLMVLVLVVYIIWRIVKGILSLSQNKEETTQASIPFNFRLKCCFLQLMLFGYSILAIGTFQLAYYVNINGVSYLYVNGQKLRHPLWYKFNIFVVVCWTIPFAMALFCANKLLRVKRITVTHFFVILTFPPSLVYFLCRALVNRDGIDETEVEAKNREQILLVLEEPFHKVTEKKSAWYWEAVLMYRRLILIGVYVFFIDPITRLYAMSLPITVFLINHLRTKPYNSRFLNWLETCSLMSLCLLVALNIFWAYNYTTAIVVTEYMGILAHVFLYVETFILLFPIIVLALLICFLVLQAIYRCLKT